uniref:Alsin Rho guanine nucleotide exchange factor ALS2 n=1 Tax=Hippocampus comes TaxID=109280 RepID=A0A3Q3E839_HIPCM
CRKTKKSFTHKEGSVRRGLLHIWQSGGPSEPLSPERVLLSQCVLQVALGEHHGLLLAQCGLVYSFGELLWRGLSVPPSAPLLEASLRGTTVVHVACGGFHCGALSEQGGIYMWGENTAGQSSVFDSQFVLVAEPYPLAVVDNEVVPPVAVRIVDLACGREHSLALSAQNELWAWGSGCQLGLVTSNFPVWKPQKVEHLAGRHVIQVACGAYHSLALVRCLHLQNPNTPKPLERRPSKRDEPFTAEDAHYCPLGVELTESMTAEVELDENKNLMQGEILSLVWFQFLDFNVLQMMSNIFGHHVAPHCHLLSSSSSEVVRSSSLVGLEEDPLRKKKVMLSHKSSSLTDINLKGKTGNRRFSLPGTPTNATPRRQQHCGSKPSSSSEDGFPSLETEVWSWGRGSEGQLGHGDQLARLQPLCIKSLTGEEVIKVAAGSHHSLALTAQCQVYSWGSNMCGQLGHVNSPATVPQQAKLSDDLRAWDVSAGQSHSLLLADGDGVQPVLMYCGQQQEPRSKRNETSCQRMGYISSVCSGGHKCALLTDRNVSGFILAIHELASIERKFYCWLSSVRKLTYLENIHLIPCTRLFLSFYKTSVRLSILIGQHSTSLTHFLHVLRRDVTSLHLLTHTQHFLDIYTEYCSAVGDFQVMGGLQSLHKLSLECLGSKQTKLAQLSELDPSVSGDGDLASVLYWPLQQLQQYSRVLLQLESSEYQSLHQSAVQYEHLSVTLQRRKKEAEATFLFWKTHSGKNTVSGLRLPQRRVLCESSNRTLTLQGAGRFSNHWFILFNDALVHIQFSTHRVYPVNLLWVKPLPENDSQGSSPGITAMSRTASYTFMGDGRFKDAQYTGSWLAGRVHGRGTMRWQDGRIYTGNFKNGLEDGYGECMIPDKLLNKAGCYQGQWRDGKIHGFGIYRYATGEVYEGCFNDGQRHGYGMLRSGKMDKTSSGVFIGQWVCDKKTGYGVSDDITRGEKYMGMWLDDDRHGSAVVVTQYGVYYEGNFRENKMSGPGLLVSDDDTAFHGEFSEDWTANGKVENIAFICQTLALPWWDF